jgi:hypothetical protein
MHELFQGHCALAYRECPDQVPTLYGAQPPCRREALNGKERQVKHPSDIQLALFAGDDLGRWNRWRMRAHVSGCPQCSRDVQAHQAARVDLRELAAEMPEGLNWSRLSPEITGNIRVGLAAGECIAGFEKHSMVPKPRLAWHAATVLACATIIVVTTLWFSLPKGELDYLAASLKQVRFDRIGKAVRGPVLAQDGIVLEASPSSIGIRENGGTMSFLQPHSETGAISVSMQGSAGVRYVDADSGQVTTNRVYYAQ